MFNFIEPVARSNGGQEIQRTGSNEEMKKEKRERESVYGQKLGPEAATTLRKNESEMHEQSGLKQQRDDVGPVDDPIEGVQLAAVMKAV